jgi:hypothetical protein
MEHVAECIRQERIVKLWMHFRAARAARDAISYFRTVANRQRKSDKASGEKGDEVCRFGIVRNFAACRVLIRVDTPDRASSPIIGPIA